LAKARKLRIKKKWNIGEVGAVISFSGERQCFVAKPTLNKSWKKGKKALATYEYYKPKTIVYDNRDILLRSYLMCTLALDFR